jgi:hypothetical protein
MISIGKPYGEMRGSEIDIMQDYELYKKDKANAKHDPEIKRYEEKRGLINRAAFLKFSIYSVSFIVFTLSVIAYRSMWVPAESSEEIMEISGIASTLFMGVAMALYIALKMLKKRMLPKAILPYGVALAKTLNAYHYPISALSYALLVTHLLFSWDISELASFDYIMGYACTVLIVLSLFTGLLKRKTKSMVKAHVLFSFAAVIPFILHLID